jgi:hypothetical protein
LKWLFASVHLVSDVSDFNFWLTVTGFDRADASRMQFRSARGVTLLSRRIGAYVADLEKEMQGFETLN